MAGQLGRPTVGSSLPGHSYLLFGNTEAVKSQKLR
jgi:hypothetical protein